MRRIVSWIMVALLLTSMLMLAFNVWLVRAQGETVYINTDGSISPSDAPISTLDNVTYMLTSNMSYQTYNGIVIERSNIIVDGAGHTLQCSEEIGTKEIYADGTNNVTIRNTNIMNYWIGIEFDYSSHIIISGNNMTSNNLKVTGGVAFFNCSYSDISDNNVNGSQAGISLDYSSYNTLSQNNLISNNFGMTLDLSSDNLVSENNIISALAIGVGLGESSYNVVSNNRIDGCINLVTSTFNAISSNIITPNQYPGDDVELYYSSDNNTLAGNNITNADPVVRIASSSFNEIYHNNFIANITQVIGATSVNFWDNGYPSGGNFWSDYNSTDMFGGPYQNLTGSDGIGDIPYIINGNNTDNYPLMKPYVFLLGDLNHDGKVDIKDIHIVAIAYGTSPGDPRWNPAADLNHDGKVDIRDVSIVAKEYGQHSL